MATVLCALHEMLALAQRNITATADPPVGSGLWYGEIVLAAILIAAGLLLSSAFLAMVRPSSSREASNDEMASASKRLI
jgi:hypothetical protein